MIRGWTIQESIRAVFNSPKGQKRERKRKQPPPTGFECIGCHRIAWRPDRTTPVCVNCELHGIRP